MTYSYHGQLIKFSSSAIFTMASQEGVSFVKSYGRLYAQFAETNIGSKFDTAEAAAHTTPYLEHKHLT